MYAGVLAFALLGAWLDLSGHVQAFDAQLLPRGRLEGLPGASREGVQCR